MAFATKTPQGSLHPLHRSYDIGLCVGYGGGKNIQVTQCLSLSSSTAHQIFRVSTASRRSSVLMHRSGIDPHIQRHGFVLRCFVNTARNVHGDTLSLFFSGEVRDTFATLHATAPMPRTHKWIFNEERSFRPSKNREIAGMIPPALSLCVLSTSEFQNLRGWAA